MGRENNNNKTSDYGEKNNNNKTQQEPNLTMGREKTDKKHM